MARIYASALSFDDGKSGISNYIENSLFNLAQENTIDVAILEKDIKNYSRKHKNIRFIPYSNIFSKSILNLIFHMFILPFLIKKEKYDFIFLPAANRRLMFFYPLHTIATFHDLSQFNVKSKYDSLRMVYIKYIIPLFLKNIESIIAVSQNTKNDLLKYFKIEDKKIHVNYNGVDINLFNLSKSDVLNVKRKFALNKEYFLYVSRIEHPGKNHLNLIKAYELLPLHIKDNYDLVLVGNPKEKAEVVLDYIKNSKVKENIKVLGFLENEELPAIFSNAKFFIFPSFYEGFGIPLVEAMAMKIPTLCASNSSLLEIGEGISVFFNEYDPMSVKQSIEDLLEDEQLQKEMTEKGLKDIKKYDWSYHAKRIIEIYETK